ncbi:carbohydrate ABC transporter permease, partial [Clostridioides difficile]
METTKNYRFSTILTEIVMVLLGLLFLVPFYFLFVNSVKTFGDLLTNSAAWPEVFQWGNYANAWEKINFPSALMNSLIVTVVSNLLLVLISSMA